MDSIRNSYDVLELEYCIHHLFNQYKKFKHPQHTYTLHWPRGMSQPYSLNHIEWHFGKSGGKGGSFFHFQANQAVTVKIFHFGI